MKLPSQNLKKPCGLPDSVTILFGSSKAVSESPTWVWLKPLVSQFEIFRKEERETEVSHFC